MSTTCNLGDMVLPFAKVDVAGEGKISMTKLVEAFQDMNTGLSQEQARDVMTKAIQSSGAQVGESVRYNSLLHWAFLPTLEDRKTASIQFIKHITVQPWSVLGQQKRLDGKVEAKAPKPGADIAFIDPAGLHHIQGGGPSGAGGASGGIYIFLNIQRDDAFPAPVKTAITAPLLAKLQRYDEKTCIHVIGPNFNTLNPPTQAEATFHLAVAYLSVFKEFAASELKNLRLLPISGSIFAGSYLQRMPTMTVQALQWCFVMLTADERERALAAVSIDMCIFDENDLASYRAAFGPAEARPRPP